VSTVNRLPTCQPGLVPEVKLHLRAARRVYPAHKAQLSWPYHPADPGAAWSRPQRRGSASIACRRRKHRSLRG
jgi:hypothetical protein